MIRKWHIKAVVQKSISFFPFKHRINYFFQKYVTKGLDLTEDLFFDRLGHAVTHIKAYEKHSDRKDLTTAYELGTGWYPIIPIAFYLYGVQKIQTTDISNLCNASRIILTLKMFLKQIDSNNILPIFTKHGDRIANIRQIIVENNSISFAEILERLSIDYAIADMTQENTIEHNSFDLVTSNNTFEHVYSDILRKIIKNLSKITRKGGVMSHFIDLSDHYAHLDSSINDYNFLKFSDRQWHYIDNSIQPMNRFRINDYRKIYQSLNIPLTEEINRPGNIEALLSIKINEKYISNKIEDNAVSHSYMISKML